MKSNIKSTFITLKEGSRKSFVIEADKMKLFLLLLNLESL